ncbi:MAG: leucine-rich repeat domain-containing protein [Clostridia bacterium]|nr:leucine-rich repeat domain-containing protein [Clostridia bacterium]
MKVKLRVAALLAALLVLAVGCDILGPTEPTATLEPTPEETPTPTPTLEPTPTPVPVRRTDDFEYLLYEDHIEIIKYIGSQTFVLIPDYLEFLPITHIGAEAFAGTDVTFVEIGEQITDICERAFAGCAMMSSVKLGENLLTIGDEAFADCIKLGGISIAHNETAIGARAFSGCLALTTVTIGESVTEIGEAAFENCSSSLTIFGSSGSYAETYAAENGIRFSAD